MKNWSKGTQPLVPLQANAAEHTATNQGLFSLLLQKGPNDVTGTIKLPEDVTMVLPGDTIEMTVDLLQPIAMEEGVKFAIREGGHTVGAGFCMGIIE